MEKSLYEAVLFKYFGIQLYKRLTWKQQINHMALKQNKSNVMLSKLRNVLDIKTLRSAMLHLFVHKTLIQLKGIIYYRNYPSE